MRGTGWDSNSAGPSDIVYTSIYQRTVQLVGYQRRQPELALLEELDLNEVSRVLCKPGTVWATKEGTTEKLSFPHTALSRYVKAWYSFICANLMPIRHQNDVTKDRAVLLFGIVTGKRVDVGRIIYSSITRYLMGGTSGVISHASMIT